MAAKHVLMTVPLAMAMYSRDTLGVCLAMSLLAFAATDFLIPSIARLVDEAGMTGKDMNKAKPTIIPESLGIAAGAVYLATLFVFLPFPFLNWTKTRGISLVPPALPFQQLGEYSSALLSICCMLFLGFVDDVMNVKWRHKIVLPAVSSLPLLAIYSVTCGVTNVIVPIPLRFLLGKMVELGPLYYLYMASLTVFCTHAINILAGVNGVEVGQTIIIALSILLNDLLSIAKAEAVPQHLFSLHLIIPYIAVSCALLKWNWFPAKVFVGDTFCYFAGMTFAVAGILGHFSKTLLLFFIPQIANFFFSIPQLLGLVPCPRHRLPCLNHTTGLLEPSKVKMEKSSPGGLALVRCAGLLGLVKVFEDDGSTLTINNLTLLNWLLVRIGPLREDRLAIVLMLLQSACNMFGLYVRHRLAAMVF